MGGRYHYKGPASNIGEAHAENEKAKTSLEEDKDLEIA